jgi:CRISPR-associated RAMP protein (TIGR02581 family)
MFHARCNQLVLHWKITPRDPLLIKAGEPFSLPREKLATWEAALDSGTKTFADLASEIEAERKALGQKKKNGDLTGKRKHCQDMIGPLDMEFVRTRRRPNSGLGAPRWEPFLPGSSLKGALRAHAERLARTLNSAHPERVACDVLSKDTACSHRSEWKGKRPEGPAAYKEACLMCRLFGHTFLAGRVRLSDAYLEAGAGVEPVRRIWKGQPNQEVVPANCRDGVGIDRVTGAAASGIKYDLEVWDRAAFEGCLELVNFELWQVGLLAYLLDDLNAGRLRLGYGTHRGLGRVTVTITRAELSYFGQWAQNPPAQCVVKGIGELMRDSTDYGLWQGAQGQAEIRVPGQRVSQANPFEQMWQMTDLEALWSQVALLWYRFIQEYPMESDAPSMPEAAHA